MHRKRPPTMADVARRSGVSPMTVSRALKPGSAVSDETRARIRQAADELGYILDARAAALSSLRSGFVAAVVPSLNNSNFADTLRGLTEAIGPTGMQLLLGYTDYDVAEEERTVETLLQRRPEALVLTGGVHTPRCRAMIAAADLPVVETWDLPAAPLGHVVGFSNAAAAEAMVHHLHDQGYRRLCFLGGDETRDTRGADRRRGFVRAVGSLGLGAPRLVAAGPPPISMREGAAAFRRLMAEWPDTDAVLGVSDLSAFGAMSEALRMGLRVPGDIAFAGFGAFDISETCHPRLTTTEVDALGIGREAGRIIVASLSAKSDGASQQYRTTPRIVARESTQGPGFRAAEQA